MILGTEAIGLLSIGKENDIIYGPATYIQTANGLLNISVDDFDNSGVALDNEAYQEDTTVSLKIGGVGIAGYVYTQDSTANLNISGIGGIGFIYDRSSTVNLTISATDSQNSIQSDSQPFVLINSAQSLMSWYTYNLQTFEQTPTNINISALSVDYFVSGLSGGGITEIPQVWIG
jgi:hypothetical protein